MFFDVSVQTFDISCFAVDNEEETHVLMQLLTGMVLPGPGGQKALLPMGGIKVQVGKGAALNLAEKLKEAAEELPDPKPEKPESDIVIAQNMEQAKQAADMDEAIRKGEVPVE